MNFFQFLKSLDDLLYEVVSWILFYPMTLLRVLLHPLQMTDYAAEELKQEPEQRFDEALSPPIFLLLTVIAAHALELALVGESKVVTETKGVAGLISDDTSLILMRLVAFATIPLIMAAYTVHRQGVAITRASLETPFYAQCYINVPFALVISLGGTISQLPSPICQLAAAILALASVVGFLGVQTAWFRKQLELGLVGAFGNAVAGYVTAIGFMLALGWLLSGL